MEFVSKALGQDRTRSSAQDMQNPVPKQSSRDRLMASASDLAHVRFGILVTSIRTNMGGPGTDPNVL